MIRNLSNSYKKKNSGFTLVETLVAISILMIAIAGPLVIAGHGLNAALNAKNQMVASYLAQESIEMVKNTKDNNILRGVSWLGGLNFPGNCSTQTNACDASSLDSGFLICYGAPCPIFFGGVGFNHTSGTPTPFSRLFYLTQINANEVVINVKVFWKQGSVPDELDLSSTMVNDTR